MGAEQQRPDNGTEANEKEAMSSFVEEAHHKRLHVNDPSASPASPSLFPCLSYYPFIWFTVPSSSEDLHPVNCNLSADMMF